MPIKALIFDAEGVVIDTMRTVWIPADIEFCRRHGFDCPMDIIARQAGTSLLEGVKLFKEELGITGDDHTLLQERITIAEKLFQQDVTFVDGFMDFIEKHSLPRAVATSLKGEFLASVEERVHLNSIFNNHVYSIYNVGVRAKPHPNIFLYAAKELGIDPRHCLVFEDAPNGIEAARRAGMRCIGLTTSFPRERLTGATAIIDGFSEINLNAPELH